MAYVIWFAVNAVGISEKKAKWFEIPNVICSNRSFFQSVQRCQIYTLMPGVHFICNENDLKAWISVLISSEEYPKLHHSYGLWCLVSNSSRPNTPAWHHYSGFRGVWSRAQAEASLPLKTLCSWLIALFPVFVCWRKVPRSQRRGGNGGPAAKTLFSPVPPPRTHSWAPGLGPRIKSVFVHYSIALGMGFLWGSRPSLVQRQNGKHKKIHNKYIQKNNKHAINNIYHHMYTLWLWAAGSPTKFSHKVL